MPITLPEEAEDWIDTYGRRLDDDEAFAEAASGWGVEFDGDLVFEIHPDDTYGGEPLYFYLALRDGECLSTDLLEDPNAVAHGFTLRGGFSDWRRLLDGELDIVQAVMDGTFDIDGSTMQAMRYQEVFVEMCDIATQIDTEFEV